MVVTEREQIYRAVKCLKCGKLHLEHEDTYVKIVGNILIGKNGGILGGRLDDPEGLPTNIFCKPCLMMFLNESLGLDRIGSCHGQTVREAKF